MKQNLAGGSSSPLDLPMQTRKDQWKRDVACMFLRCVKGARLMLDSHVQLLGQQQQNMTVNWQWWKIHQCPLFIFGYTLVRVSLRMTIPHILRRYCTGRHPLMTFDVTQVPEQVTGEPGDRCTILHRVLLVFRHLNSPFIATSYSRFKRQYIFQNLSGGSRIPQTGRQLHRWGHNP